LNNIFTILLLLSILCWIIGLIKPSLVVRWGNPEKRTRKKAFAIYSILVIIFFFAVGITGNSNTQQPVQEKMAEQTQQETSQQPQQESAPVSSEKVGTLNTNDIDKIKTIINAKCDIEDSDISITKDDKGEGYCIRLPLTDYAETNFFYGTCYDIFHDLYTSGLSISTISITDSENGKVVANVILDSQSAQKIDWSTVGSDLYKKCDYTKFDPQYKKHFILE